MRLGLAVPVAHVVSAGRLFAAGILMKDGSALERLESHDRRGVRQDRHPDHRRTCRCRSTTFPQGELSSIAKALAQRSVHPASRALAQVTSVTNAEAMLTDLHEVPGQGVEAVVDGKRARLGRQCSG